MGLNRAIFFAAAKEVLRVLGARRWIGSFMSERNFGLVFLEEPRFRI
jgi:hypothetical protein